MARARARSRSDLCRKAFLWISSATDRTSSTRAAAPLSSGGEPKAAPTRTAPRSVEGIGEFGARRAHRDLLHRLAVERAQEELAADLGQQRVGEHGVDHRPAA